MQTNSISAPARVIDIPGEVRVEARRMSADELVDTIPSPLSSALGTVSGALGVGLGTDLISFAKTAGNQTGPLASGVVLAALGTFSMVAGQVMAQPYRAFSPLKGIVATSTGICVAGIATAQFGATHLPTAAGIAARNARAFIGGTALATVGAAVFFPTLVTQYTGIEPLDRRMTTTVVASVAAMGSALIVGFGAGSFDNLAWARSLFSIAMIAAMATVIASALRRAPQPAATANGALPDNGPNASPSAVPSPV